MNRSLTYVRELLGVVLIGALLSLILGGCGLMSGPLRIPVTVSGTSDMNSGGNAAVVRIYQLSQRTNFQQASIEAFWRDDEAVLGGDLVMPRIELLLYPEDEEAVELEIHESARFVGVAVDFHDPDADNWRRLFTVDELRQNRPVTFTVGERRLQLAAEAE